jgi:hypothetical protein
MASGEEGYHYGYLDAHKDVSKDRFAEFLVTDFNKSKYKQDELLNFQMMATELYNKAKAEGDTTNISRFDYILYNINKQLGKKYQRSPVQREPPRLHRASRNRRRRSSRSSRSRSRSPTQRRLGSPVRRSSSGGKKNKNQKTKKQKRK